MPPGVPTANIDAFVRAARGHAARPLSATHA
jgi:hypothetical protein